MIKLTGHSGEYLFDETKPFTRPGKFSTVYCGANNFSNPILIKRHNYSYSINEYEKCIFHPSFVKTIEQVEKDGVVYSIRPFINGTPLSDLNKIDWFNSEVNISLLKAIIQKTGEAIYYLHQQELVHLDIRPHNIIIENIDQLSNLKISIIDLDSLRKFHEEKEINSFPLVYAAPELLLKRSRLIDIRTDIYALAITFYELIFKSPPFYNSNAEFLMHLMLNSSIDIGNNQFSGIRSVLNKGAGKVKLGLPPNMLDEIILEEKLIAGMNSRYQDVRIFCEELQKEIKFSPGRINRLLQFFNGKIRH